MKKIDSQPLNKNFICSNDLEDQLASSKELVPIFLLPFGFHSLSLFQIAQYYDGTATNFYKNIIFTNDFENNPDIQHEDFSKYKFCDYSHYFHQIMQNFQIPKSMQSPQYIKLCDRYFDIDLFLSLPSLGDLSYISYHIPKGNEDGIIYILAQSREFLRSHLFSLMSVPFSSLSAKITITSGQPFLFNKILSSNYSNVESINSRKESLTTDMNDLKQHEYLIDWALVSQNGFPSLIIVRPPQYLRICDRNLELFNTIDKAFENSNVYLVSYRHSQFLNRIKFEKSDEQSSMIERPIKSDLFFCNLLKDEMKRKFTKNSQSDFESFLIYSLHFPSFYLMSCGFEKEIAMAASVEVDDPKGRAVPLFIPLLLKSLKSAELDDQNDHKNTNLNPVEEAPAPASTVLDNDKTDKFDSNNSNEQNDDENIEKSEEKIENDLHNDEEDEEENGAVFVSPFQDQEEVESKLLLNKSNQIKIAVQEYFKFCFWLRSFISVLKFFCRRDSNGIAESSLSCFRSLPLRNRRVVISTILLLIESLKKFRKLRGQNDDFYQKVLKIFKNLFGEEFDQVLGLQKWEVPRDMRKQVVCVDNCVKMFYVRSFKNEKISVNNAIYKLTKYMDPVMKEISFDQDVPNFKFCQSYIDFLKLQKFDKIIEI